MVPIPYVPLCIPVLLRGRPGLWQRRQRLLRWWRVGMPALCPGRQTGEALARWPPGSRTVWRLRRVRTAAYWDGHVRVAWGGDAALRALPPPKDGTRYLAGEGRGTPTRGTQHPLAQQGRKSAPPPWFCGMRCAWLRAPWEAARLPVALRLLRRHTAPADQTDKAVCRARGPQCVPPAWATRVLGTGDAA